MGYTTVVHILNDRLSDIEKDPKAFVNGIIENLYGGDTIGQTTVMRTEHADVFRLYCVEGNSITLLGAYDERDQGALCLARRDASGRRLVERWIDYARDQLDRLEEKIGPCPECGGKGEVYDPSASPGGPSYDTAGAMVACGCRRALINSRLGRQ